MLGHRGVEGGPPVISPQPNLGVPARSYSTSAQATVVGVVSDLVGSDPTALARSTRCPCGVNPGTENDGHNNGERLYAGSR